MDSTRNFEQLRKETYRKVYSLAYRLSNNKADAEDLTQEVYIRAFTSFAHYKGDCKFQNWIFRITKNLYLDSLRYKDRRVKAVSYDAQLPNVGEEGIYFEPVDTEPSPEDQLMASIPNADLQIVLDSLKPKEYELIRLVDMEGMTHKEATELLCINPSSVRSRIYRIHKVMRLHLEQLQTENR
jgi:RNA polymerase sigma-70 factor (ECF subfamily)